MLLGNAVSAQSLRTVSSWLWIIAGIGLLAAALSIAFANVTPGLWRPLAIFGGLAGALSFTIFWDGQLQQFTNQGGIGMIISLVVVGGAAFFAHAFG